MLCLSSKWNDESRKRRLSERGQFGWIVVIFWLSFTLIWCHRSQSLVVRQVTCSIWCRYESSSVGRLLLLLVDDGGWVRLILVLGDWVRCVCRRICVTIVWLNTFSIADRTWMTRTSRRVPIIISVRCRTMTNIKYKCAKCIHEWHKIWACFISQCTSPSNKIRLN